MPDGWLDKETFLLTFETNTYENCNQIDKGAIFYLEKGARISDKNSDYRDCSALEGGLAYVTGHGTYLHLSEPRR